MCGIYGWFDSSRPFEKEYDHSMRTPLASLQHRGPEGFSALKSQNFYVEHHRLEIVTRGSQGRQPFYHPKKNSGVIFNGEIYNFKELREDLGAEYAFETESDVEVLFAGLELKGEDFLSRIRGIFAGFYWSQERNKAFLFRDQFGVKPLYYRRQGELTFFSSEIKPLLEGKKARINHQALYEHLRLRYCLGAHTIFRDIFKVLPGEILDVQGGKRNKTFHFQPQKSSSEKSIEEEFLTAVRLEIPDFPFYSLLSGGVDSSAVAAALESQTDLVRFMTVRGEGYEEKEAYAALQNPSLLDTCDLNEFREVDLQDLVEILEEPIGDAIGLVQERLFRKIAQKTKVAMSGEGADELFFGYAHHWILYLLEKVKGFPFKKSVFLLNFFFPLIRKTLPHGTILSRKHLRGIFRPWMENQNFSQMAIHVMSLFSEEEACALLADQGDHQSLEEKVMEITPNGMDSLDDLRAFELSHWLPFYSLARLDRLSMNHSLELRVPYLDQAFAGKALQFSFRENLSIKQRKRVLRQFLTGILPPSLCERQEKAFTVSSRNSERLGLRRMCLQILESKEQRGLFERKAVKKVLADQDHYFYDKRLFNLALLTLWFERFVQSVD